MGEKIHSGVMCLVMLKEIIRNEICTKSCDCNLKNLTQSIVFISNRSVNDSVGPFFMSH